MRRIAAVLFVALMGAGLGRAEAPEGIEKRRVLADCDEKHCVLTRDDLEGLVGGNRVLLETAERLQAELRKLRDIKGCGKLEVVPPARPTKPASAPDGRRT